MADNAKNVFEYAESSLDTLEPVGPINLAATVVKGFGRGSKELGIPTANMNMEQIGSLVDELKTGIYMGWATVNGKGPYKAVTSVGWNPYYDNKEKTVEPHLLHEFPEDFYGEELKITLCAYLRGEANFPSLDSLISAINLDKRITDEALDNEPFITTKSSTFLTE